MMDPYSATAGLSLPNDNLQTIRAPGAASFPFLRAVEKACAFQGVGFGGCTSGVLLVRGGESMQNSITRNMITKY